MSLGKRVQVTVDLWIDTELAESSPPYEKVSPEDVADDAVARLNAWRGYVDAVEVKRTYFA